MRAPKKLYWVEVITRGKLRYGKKGGGKYTSREAAEDQQATLDYVGIESELYETQDLVWTKVKSDR